MSGPTETNMQAASKWHEESLISLCSQSRFSVGDGVFCSYKIPFYVFLKELSV